MWMEEAELLFYFCYEFQYDDEETKSKIEV